MALQAARHLGCTGAQADPQPSLVRRPGSERGEGASGRGGCAGGGGPALPRWSGCRVGTETALRDPAPPRAEPGARVRASLQSHCASSELRLPSDHGVCISVGFHLTQVTGPPPRAEVGVITPQPDAEAPGKCDRCTPAQHPSGGWVVAAWPPGASRAGPLTPL